MKRLPEERLRAIVAETKTWNAERRLMAAELLAAREKLAAATPFECFGHAELVARAEKAEAECAQWKSKWEHTIDNAACGLSRQLQQAEKEVVVKRDEATAWKAMADVRLAERNAARAEVAAARAAAAEVDRAGGDAPHEPCMGLAAWIRCRAEMHRAEVERLKADTNTDALNNDVLLLLRAVGLPDHARPASCHRVVNDEIIPAIERLKAENETLRADRCIRSAEADGKRIKELVAKLADADAYRERTEAALSVINKWARAGILIDAEDLSGLGLAREAKEGA